MLPKRDVKENLLEHSEAKVRLLGEYLARYLSIISNDGYTTKIHLYDLFCGRGIYKNGGEGSPIVALRQIRETYKTVIEGAGKKWPKINCYFNDIDKPTIEHLNVAISANTLYETKFGTLELTSNDYKDEIERLKLLFKKFGNEKAFVFIDPYGYKEVKASHILGLIDCNNKSEVLLWLPIQFMYRFADEGRPDSLTNFINELGIKKEVESANNVWEFIHVLKVGFQDYLGANFFVDNFSLKKDENTVFCLFFFTSHIKGFEQMLESKWKIDTEEGRGWRFNIHIPTLFSGHQTNELEDNLKPFLKSKACSNSEVYEFTLRMGYLPKHSNEILRKWQNNGSCEVYLPTGELARKNSFYLTYPLYKKEPYKVFFKLK